MSCVNGKFKQEKVTELSSVEIHIHRELSQESNTVVDTDTDTATVEKAFKELFGRLRLSYPLVFCPLQRSLLDRLDFHCEQITQSMVGLGANVSCEQVLEGILLRQNSLLRELSFRRWLSRKVRGRVIRDAWKFVKHADLKADTSDTVPFDDHEMCDLMDTAMDNTVLETVSFGNRYLPYKPVIPCQRTPSIIATSISSLSPFETTFDPLDSDCSDDSNESMTLLDEYHTYKEAFPETSLGSHEQSLILDHTVDSMIEDTLWSDCSDMVLTG